MVQAGDMMQNMHTGRVIIVDALDEGYFSGHYYWDSSQRETYAYTQIDTDVEVYDQSRFDTESIVAIPALDRTPEQEAADRSHEAEYVANYGAGTGTLESRLETTQSLETRLEPAAVLEQRLEPMVTRAELDSALAAGERRHVASLSWARKSGALRADLAAVHSRLTGVVDGMIPSMRKHHEMGVYSSPEAEYEHVLKLMEESLNEARTYIRLCLDRDSL